MKAWQKLGICVMPKAHACEHHCIAFMQKYNTGLGEYDEEFVERCCTEVE